MKLSERWRRRTLSGALLALALPLVSCGDDTPAQPIVVVTPEPVRGVIAQTSFSGFPTDLWVSIELKVSQKGTVDGTVDWTFPDTWMYVYFGQQRCDLATLTAEKCAFLLRSETQQPKPRVFTTGQIDAGTYYLYLYNVPKDNRLGIGSDNTEAVSLQLGLTIYPFTSAGPGVLQLGPVRTLTPGL
jgi:hypothetical protein